jgi:hypothetical protein
MTKKYDIVNIIGTNSFTYQLYADLAVPVEGSSTVNSEIEPPPTFVMSADINIINPAGFGTTYMRNANTTLNSGFPGIVLHYGTNYIIQFSDGSPTVAQAGSGTFKLILLFGVRSGGSWMLSDTSQYQLIEADMVNGETYTVKQDGSKYYCYKGDTKVLEIPYTTLSYGSNGGSGGDTIVEFINRSFGTFP